MKYKGYQGQIVFDIEANIFRGELIGLKDMISFQSPSYEEIEHAIKSCIDDYLGFCNEVERPSMNFIEKTSESSKESGTKKLLAKQSNAADALCYVSVKSKNQ